MPIRAFQCFRAGNHTATDGRVLHFSEDDLSRTALVYDAKKMPAPLVLGHPDESPHNYGKVLGLVAHSGKLMALADVHESLIDAVRNGHYKKVSASFHTPDGESNPMPSFHYLRHIGFLGAAAPSVKGMEPLCFAEHGQPVGSYRSEEDLRSAIHRVARDIQSITPAMPFIQAAIRAESLLSNHGN